MPTVETKTVTNVKEFLDYLDIGKRISQIIPYVYRGQTFDKPLVPSLLRFRTIPRGYGKTWKKFEGIIIAKFQAQAIPYLNPLPEDIHDWLALAQHHGVPTRLLDWTENPLVALYFAVQRIFNGDDSPQPEESVVWRVNVTQTNYRSHHMQFKRLEEQLDQLQTNTEIDIANTQQFAGMGVWYPGHATVRIKVQQGCFTMHYLPEGNKPFTPLEKTAERENAPFKLEKFVIPKLSRLTIKKELSDLGINDFSLFPDLDGLGRLLRWEIDRIDDMDS
jgi:hypothetical protein